MERPERDHLLAAARFHADRAASLPLFDVTSLALVSMAASLAVIADCMAAQTDMLQAVRTDEGSS